MLETPRLVVRPFVAEDFDCLYALRADDEVARYLSAGRTISSRESGRAFAITSTTTRVTAMRWDWSA
jgi:RimJ/RimL family protein N-acetyltransferase